MHHDHHTVALGATYGDAHAAYDEREHLLARGRADRRRYALVRHVQAEARAAVSLGPAACVALAVRLAAELPEAWQ